MYLDTFFAEALSQPPEGITYWVAQQLASLFPDRGCVAGNDWDFRVEDYARAGNCEIRYDSLPHPEVWVTWETEAGTRDEPARAWLTVNWRGHTLDVVIVRLERECVKHFWILADTPELARDFFTAVASWKEEVTGKILVFEQGGWSASAQLYRDLELYHFGNLILDPDLCESFRADLQRFFQAVEQYERLGVPWKRGLLLLGPPGNGKTHAIKALVQDLGLPTLYVKSFESERTIDATNIKRVFARARQQAPCVLILEDLDSLLDARCTSFFLNELDGFAANRGIALIATTNHPERLDPAILERPSRFDCKYHFALPALRERQRYLAQWSENAVCDLALNSDDLTLLSQRTDGFSYAYLKELCLAATLEFAGNPTAAEFPVVLLGKADELIQQMKSTRDARQSASSPNANTLDLDLVGAAVGE